MRTLALTTTLTLALLAPVAPAVAATPAARPQAPATPTALSPASVTAALAARFPDEKPTLKDTITWADGATYARYERTWKGLPVVGGRYAVPLSSGVKGTATGAVPGQAIAKAPIVAGTTSPVVSTARATALGRAAAQATLKEHGGKVTTSSTRLVVYVGRDGQGRLAHDVFTLGTDPEHGGARIHTYIDARTGALLGKTNMVQGGTDTGNGVYSGKVSFSTLVDSTGGTTLGDAYGNVTKNLKHQDAYNANFWNEGTKIYKTDNGDSIWGSGTLYSGDKQAVDTQYALEATYKFYASAYGRRGEANDGQGTLARVHAGQQRSDGTINGCWENATWDGYHINIGDGSGCSKPFSETDIIAHEVTHGVTYWTAGLEYELEAGGLNESMSDIFGFMVERYAANKGLSTGDAWDYYIGERLDFYGNGSAIRYFDRPSRDGISYNCWSPDFAKRDQYGNEMVNVHFSSGPMNHAFYLLSEGSGTKTVNGQTYSSATCNGSTVSGIGPDAAARIVYSALTSPTISTTATYLQFRDEMVRAAKSLYGPGSAQCRATERAMSGIGVAPGAGSPVCGLPAASTAIGPRDVTGDGIGDVVLINGTDGRVTELRGTGAGTVTGPYVTSNPDWRGMTQRTQTGNWDGSGAGDMMTVHTNGDLYLYTRRAETGSWGTMRWMGYGWNTYKNLFSPGDLDGDGLSDLLGIDGNGDQWFYHHKTDGGYAPRVRTGYGWGIYTKVFTSGDVTGDGRADVMAIDSAGDLWMYAGKGNGYLAARARWGTGGWNTYQRVVGVGDLNGDKWQDLVALDGTGNLFWYRNDGGTLAPRALLRSGLSGYTLVG